MDDNSASFLSLFKHKSAIDPRLASSVTSLDSDDSEGESSHPYQLGTTSRKSNKRKRTAESNVKRSKSDMSSDRITQSKAHKQGSLHLPVTLDDDSGTHSPEILGPTSGSPLPSYLAHALQKVNENKKLRAQLKSSMDPAYDTDHAQHLTNTFNNSDDNNPTPHPSKSSCLSPPLPTCSSTVLQPPPTCHTSSTTSTNEKSAPTVYSVDSDDESDHKYSNTYNSNTTHTNATTSNSENSISVLFFVYSSPNDQQPLKFRFLKTEAFTKLLNAYCKFKKFDGSSAGIKWYGIALDPKQTPLHYEMSEEEKLYYYDKNGISEHYSNQTPSTTADHNASTMPHIRDDDSDAVHAPITTCPSSSSTTSSSTLTDASGTTPSDEVPQDVITLKLREGPNTQRFRIRITDPFKKLVIGYATKRNLDPSKITLLFDGLPLDADGTPKDTDMESDDIIDVKIVK
eukprot:Phypoly_transcript_05444.p1 GENE.Phypoly_transcript_05444~~Phypoly_transcript_05444.p1  ORF type:complete len:456 (+),score=76.14 Phypoly_transcript_05444:65-1432(+)